MKVAEKENKDDQLFKQGIDSLLKAPMQRLLRYPLLLERYKKEAENERIDSLSIDEIDRAICSIRNIRYDIFDPFVTLRVLPPPKKSKNP